MHAIAELARITGPRLGLEIKACPFCAGEALIAQNPYEYAPRVAAHLSCRACGIRTPEVMRQDADTAATAAIELWNRRVGIDPLVTGIMTADEARRRDEIFAHVRNGKRSINWARLQIGLPPLEDPVAIQDPA